MRSHAGLPAVATSRESLQGRRRARQFMMLTGTFVFLLTGAACSGTGSAATSQPPKVVFFAEGSGTASGAVTMGTETGGTVQLDAALPMHDKDTGAAGLASDKFKSGQSLYISVQNKEAAGSVTCRIEVDGNVVDEATSSGGYKVVSCTAKVP